MRLLLVLASLSVALVLAGPVSSAPTAIVTLAGAQALDATQLVLQPSDAGGWTTQSAPQLTSDDPLQIPAKYGRVSGAAAAYQSAGLLGGLPASLGSKAVVFRNATGAHGAFLEVAANLDRSMGSPGSATQIGQEGRTWQAPMVTRDYRQQAVLWRQGNVIAEIGIAENPISLKTAIVTYPQRQQARIAALVPPADPGPPIVVKPVIAKPLAQPAQPRAGKRFALTFQVTQSNDGAPLTNATVKSRVTVAGATIPNTFKFSAGTLRISFVVPKSAKGKQLKVATTIKAEQATTKTITFRVR
jgi:hypothetical protein